MHFTVHFRGSNSYQEDYSYGLVFIPCPCWIKGDREILNLNPERPDYCLSSIKKLMEQEKLADEMAAPKSAFVIVHPTGHGSPKDLSTLQSDLELEGFTAKICSAA